MGTGKRDGVPVPGQVLHDRLEALLTQQNETPIRLHGVECLAVCNDGCAAAITLPGKWSYLLGRLTPDKAADLLSFAASYRLSRTGTVMPSKRPASLSDMILGRIPAALEGNAA
jgi:predicted metal-binding protein